MPAKFIVVVSDRDDGKRAEITLLDDARKAEVLVETLLEAGFEQERIRLFSGDQAEMQVTYRPQVSLTEDPQGATATKESLIGEAVEPLRAAGETGPEEATPFVKDGVRFSSLFRPA